MKHDEVLAVLEPFVTIPDDACREHAAISRLYSALKSGELVVHTATEAGAALHWRPIESAPRDGAWVLLSRWNEEDVRFTRMFWAARGQWTTQWKTPRWWDGIEPSGLAGPTHWMQITELPSSAKPASDDPMTIPNDTPLIEAMAAAIWGGYERLWDQPSNVWACWELGTGMGYPNEVEETRTLNRHAAQAALTAALATGLIVRVSEREKAPTLP